MHVPQSIAAASELKYLASVLRQIISPRLASPIIQIFQDTMTGSFRISQDSVRVPEHIAMNIISRMKKPISGYKRQNRLLNGKEIISTAFPLMNIDSSIKVENGSLKSGVLRKSAFGAASEGAIHVIYNDFGPKRAAQFINDIQNVVTKYNLFSGFSVGASDLIANIETDDFIKKTIADGKKKIADIMSSVHNGTFLNISGRPDGEELENKIMSALKEINSLISESVNNSLPQDNRMVQMVKSGSKGGDLNITQMMALLGQQFVAGKRIQYTLQDRTLPHFSRYDDGMESRGFVENSFITGIRPAEFFFHAMGGREGLIDTAVKTSDSGYIQRKLVKTMEDLHVEYDGTVRNVNGGVIQFHYGGDGIDSVCVERLECTLGTMTMEQIYRDFAVAPGDLSAVLQKDTDDIPDNVDQILKDRDVMVRHVLRYMKKDKVSSPVNFKRLAQKYRNTFSVKTDLTPRYVVDELTKLCDSKTVRHNKLFQILLRFYLSPKKAILDLRLTRDLFDELLKEVAFKYTKSVVHAGEMVGTLGAQSIGEPTTQLTLNTFHSAGTAKANATAGVPRIIELLSVSHNPKNPSNTVYLDPSIAGSQDSAIYKAKEIQKTTLRDITKSVRIYYDPNPLSSNSLIQEDRDILQSYEKFSVTQGQCSSPWIMRLELDRQEMAARQVVDLPLVRTKIENNKILKVFDCIHSDTNSPDKLVMRIVFGADTVKNALSLRFIEDKLLDTVLTGVDGIGRVFPREITNQLLWDEKTGAYTATKQYVLDVEGTNLLDLSVLPNIDPFRTFSDDIHEILDVFGIETVRVALYEEFAGVLEAADGVDYHHLMMLVDSMTYPGFVLQVDRFGMNKNVENGVLAKSSFEETSKILFNAALAGDFDNMKGVSANIMFGQKPPCGTGFVDILVDETKLPEGSEEDHTVFEAELNAVNLLVEQEQAKDDVVNMADILME